MYVRKGLWAAGLGLAVAVSAGHAAADGPKRGGTLTYLIPADAPPSFDGHRETTYATVHAAAPYYSVLIRVPPDNPASTTAFLPALSDPFTWIYKKETLEKDPHWYEKNILGSGPFKFVAYEVGQSIKGARNPDYYHQGQPYLDGIVGIFA